MGSGLELREILPLSRSSFLHPFLQRSRYGICHSINFERHPVLGDWCFQSFFLHLHILCRLDLLDRRPAGNEFQHYPYYGCKFSKQTHSHCLLYLLQSPQMSDLHICRIQHCSGNCRSRCKLVACSSRAAWGSRCSSRCAWSGDCRSW